MRFSKWHALGNSYLLVERAELGVRSIRLAAGSATSATASAPTACSRSSRREGAEAEIVIWNPDGSVAEFSGNGSRIAAAWLVERAAAARVTISAGGRAYPASVRDDGMVAMAVGEVEVGRDRDGRARRRADRADRGVCRQPARGRAARRRAGGAAPARAADRDEHDRFPERTNVQLVRVDGPHEVTALVWERGAGETTASGSSAVAVASAAIANGWCESPVTVQMPGGELRSSWTRRTG